MNEILKRHQEKPEIAEESENFTQFVKEERQEVNFSVSEVPIPVLTMDNPQIKQGFPF
jgi:hypothetical protein